MSEEQSKAFSRFVTILGSVASILSVCMFVSYVFNMIGFVQNPSPDTDFPIQTLVAFINCCAWTAYGFLLPQKNIPILVANTPGVFVTLATIICWCVVIPH